MEDASKAARNNGKDGAKLRAKLPKVKADKSQPGEELQLSLGNLSDAAKE